MCTISWIFGNHGYRLFFNRDEQLTRPRADPPQQLLIKGTRALMPIDPAGGGSWCAVNEHGVGYALLNFYQGRWPKGRLRSRGQIVKHCSGFADIMDAQAYVADLDLHKFAPFSLLCFSPEVAATPISMLRWDGRKLTESQQASPLISSALRYQEVFSSRIQVYREIIGDPVRPDISEQSFLALHSSHAPTRSALSVCMHRDDAQTVSFSKVTVDSERILYHYADGPPCHTPIKVYSELARASR